jgi:equilibrative nucleoside transporter 1/2/3
MRGHTVPAMDSRTTIDKVRALFRKSDVEQTYEPLGSDSLTTDEDVRRPVICVPDSPHGLEAEQDKTDEGEPFSWLEYSIFLLLGIAMLWAWYVALLVKMSCTSNICTGICS